MSHNAFLLISSTSRSGSTLLDKLLANHPALSVLSQPFPLLYVDAKQHYHQHIGHPEDYYVLNHYFGESRYRPADLHHWLESDPITATRLLALIETMSDYSGATTPLAQPQRQLNDYAPAQLADTLKFLLKAYAHRPAARYFGAKEIHVEEFLPYLIDHGFKTITVIRDPRDIAVSMNTGKGRDYTGQLRPLLFNLYNWRKSVAFALGLDSQPNSLYLRYEDLVEQPGSSLNRICSFLGVEDYDLDWLKNGIYDQSGQQWAGNSSHHGNFRISNRSIGRYKTALDSNSRNYIEAICGPEMYTLGYLKNPPGSLPDLSSYHEPWPIERDDFSPDYSRSSANLSAETDRRQLLENRQSSPDPHARRAHIERRFILEAAYHALQSPSQKPA